ncbi:LysE family transporter [Flavobacterium xueshanense]|uniref:LysE type translocator n=1 Tax=Flavobacterium xueshanense TaxID=935223 RepID=A0A1I2CZG3_9FLAO|nr:LysE family transporter [Flavobacterium xueshanense]SFE73120.1 LysE type translocator [Flavobacterium xueshanense]
MKALKNIFIGFLVSFIGSIPLGYLNVIGFEIYIKLGMNSLVFFLFGVICVEMFVIYITLIFAKQLVENKKLMKFIDFFAVFFLLIIGYSFYASANQTNEQQGVLEKYAMYSPFLIGVFLSGINFLQVPFWTGWNLYLINGNYISIVNKLKLYYIAGTLIGTFAGMLTLVLILNTLSQNTTSFSKYVIPVVIPLFFVVLAFVQMIKVYKKYYRKRI